MKLKSLKTKFILYLIPLILFTSLSFLAFFINRSNYLIRQELTELGFTLVKNLSYSSELAIASEDEIFLRPYLEGILKEGDVILAGVYNKRGGSIAFNKKIEIEENIPEEIIGEMLKKRDVLKRVNFTQTGKEIYDFYSPIFISEILSLRPEAEIRELAGFARVGLSLERITTQGRTMFIMGLAITALLILLGLGISVFLAERMTTPVKQLTEGTEIIGKGNLGYRIKIKTGDEIEELANSFNQMAENLEQSRAALEEAKTALEIKVKARTKELRELTESLEERVRERTEEIRKRMEEMERFHKLTVGRELRMVGLKEENKKLIEEISRLKKELESKNLKGRAIKN